MLRLNAMKRNLYLGFYFYCFGLRGFSFDLELPVGGFSPFYKFVYHLIWGGGVTEEGRAAGLRGNRLSVRS